MIQSITGNTSWYKVTSVGNMGTSTLSEARYDLAAAGVGNYVLFGGGKSDDGLSDVVDIFRLKEDGTFERLQDGTLSLSIGREYLAAASVGNYVLFGGGYESGGRYSDVVDIFKLKEDGTFERLQDGTLSLSIGRHRLAAATVGNYVLFGGGNRGNEIFNVVDIFKLNEDGTFTHTTDKLSEARNNLAAATVGNYVLFGGGSNNGEYSNVVDIFKLKEDGTLEKLPDGTLSLSEGRYDLEAATVGNYVLFAGGINNDYLRSNVVDIFRLKEDGTFERLPEGTLSLNEVRSNLAAATVDNYVLFGGGINDDGYYSSVVNVFKLKEDGTLERLPDDTLSLSEGRAWLAAATIGNCALFGGGYNNSGGSFNVVDIFSEVPICWKTKISVPGIKKSDMAAYNIVLNDNRETAMKELHEYEKISYVELLDDAIEVTCLEETPSIDLKIRLKV